MMMQPQKIRKTLQKQHAHFNIEGGKKVLTRVSMIRKILILSCVLTMSLWIAGCQTVHHEKHQTETTQTVESEEIVVD